MNLTTIAREHYLPAIERRRCKDTANSYRSSLELHVLPYFGNRELQDIEYDEIQDWVDKIAPECGPGGAEKAWKCLRQLFNWAVRKFKLRLLPRCTPTALCCSCRLSAHSYRANSPLQQIAADSQLYLRRYTHSPHYLLRLRGIWNA